MTRITRDEHGIYDLAHVCFITKIPQRRQLSQTESVALPPTAKLHFDNGLSYTTQLDFEDTTELWLQVKGAESHPVDTEIDVPNHLSG